MEENPFEASQVEEFAEIYEKEGVDYEHLYRLAFYQRGVILCVLALCFAYVGMVINGNLFFSVFLGVAALLAMVGGLAASGMFTFLLSWEMYNPVAAFILAIFSMVPCVGLIVLLVVTGRATARLKKRGVKIGFLGASPSAVRAMQSQAAP